MNGVECAASRNVETGIPSSSVPEVADILAVIVRVPAWRLQEQRVALHPDHDIRWLTKSPTNQNSRLVHHFQGRDLITRLSDHGLTCLTIKVCRLSKSWVVKELASISIVYAAAARPSKCSS